MFWTSILFSPFLLSTAACIFADFQQLHSQVELMTLFSCNRIWEICQISGYEKEHVNGVSSSRIGSWKSSKYPAPTEYFSWQEWSLQGEEEEIRGWLMLLILPPAASWQWVSAEGWKFLKARWGMAALGVLCGHTPCGSAGMRGDLRGCQSITCEESQECPSARLRCWSCWMRNESGQ